MTPDELYQQLIVEHDRAPHNCGPLAEATHAATIDNPLCGDVVTVRLVLAGDTIERIAFEGRGCALSRAAASLMTDRVAGSTIADATALHSTFERFVAEPPDAPVPDDLGDLAAFRGVRAFRSRRTCATLAFDALAAALQRR
jgi:nitrogen fixation NifU-like protein